MLLIQIKSRNCPSRLVALILLLFVFLLGARRSWAIEPGIYNPKDNPKEFRDLDNIRKDGQNELFCCGVDQFRYSTHPRDDQPTGFLSQRDIYKLLSREKRKDLLLISINAGDPMSDGPAKSFKRLNEMVLAIEPFIDSLCFKRVLFISYRNPIDGFYLLKDKHKPELQKVQGSRHSRGHR